LRLLLVTPMPPDARGAGAIPTLLHAQLLGLRARHQVTLVTVAGPDLAELEAVERLDREGIDVHAAVRTLHRGTLGWGRRTRIVTTWLRGGTPLRTAWFAEPAVQGLIDVLADGRTFDAALAEDNAMGSFRLPAVPTVLTEYEVRRPRRVAPPPRAPREWPRWAFDEIDWRRWPNYERRVWRRFDVLQVVTRRDAEAVAAIAPDLASRIRVNPFPIELPPPNVVEEEPETVLFTGNYTHPPNVDAALWLATEILPRLERLRPRVRLLLAGPYAPPQIRSLERSSIRVLGHVPDLDAVLGRAAVVAAPVRTGGGMRMKVLHAMAAGKAVVTTPRGAEGLDADLEGPPLVIADGAEALADAAARLLEDEEARRHLGMRARAYAEKHHSPDAYVERLERVLAEANDRRSRG
jgi:glycosyltransferase involved in cell wall biosynthesis